MGPITGQNCCRRTGPLEQQCVRLARRAFVGFGRHTDATGEVIHIKDRPYDYMLIWPFNSTQDWG